MHPYRLLINPLFLFDKPRVKNLEMNRRTPKRRKSQIPGMSHDLAQAFKKGLFCACRVGCAGMAAPAPMQGP